MKHRVRAVWMAVAAAVIVLAALPGVALAAPAPPILGVPHAPAVVRAEQTFPVTGSVRPAIATTATTVFLRAIQFGPRGRTFSVAATASASLNTSGTAYSGTLSLTRPGHYWIEAVARRGGGNIAWSPLHPILVTYPYTISTPNIPRFVHADQTFEATGAVQPAITSTSTSVLLRAIVFGRDHLHFSVAATAPASLDSSGTGYSGDMSLPKGAYFIEAVVVRDGHIVSWSGLRQIAVTWPYTVSRPVVASTVTTSGVPFSLSGTVAPAITDTSTGVLLRAIRFAPDHVHYSVYTTASATLSGGGTAYAGSLTLPTPGFYFVEAVATRNGHAIAWSPLLLMRAR